VPRWRRQSAPRASQDRLPGPCHRGGSSPPSAQSRLRQHCPPEVRRCPSRPACSSCARDASPYAHGRAPLCCWCCACRQQAASDWTHTARMARLEAEKWECCHPQRRGQANRPPAQLHRRPGLEAHAGACFCACKPPRRRWGALPRVGVENKSSPPRGEATCFPFLGAAMCGDSHIPCDGVPGGRPRRQPCIHRGRVHAARCWQACVLWQEVAGWAGRPRAWTHAGTTGIVCNRAVSARWIIGCISDPSGPASCGVGFRRC
jgi:hypothetical protein